MLDVVIQRAIDVGDVAGGERDEAEPVVVELQARRVRERERQLGDLAPEQRRRARDRVRDEQRGEVRVVVAPPPPHRLAQHAPARVDEPLVAVGEHRAADRRAQRRELLRPPAIVLIAQRQQSRLARRQPERAFEVAIEAEPALGARHDEALVAVHGRADRREVVGAGAVVADHADPAPVRLRAQRLDLRAEQGGVGFECRHADRNQPGLRAAERGRALARRYLDAAERGDELAAREPRGQRQLDAIAVRARRDRHGPPEPAAIAAQPRILGRRPPRGMQHAEDVRPRHPHRRRAMPHAVDEQLDAVHGRLPVVAGAVAEDGGRRAGRQRARQRALEVGHQAVDAHRRGNLSCTPMTVVATAGSAGRSASRAGLATAALLVVLTGIGGLLRLAVADQSLFGDELSTYWIVATHDLGGVVSVVREEIEITPPLSFVLSWLTTRIDVTPELLRAPSLLAGVAAIPLVYLVGVRTVGRAAALVAAAITALAPFMIYYSAEAREYEPMLVLVLLSTLALLTALRDDRARWWIAYGACTCAAVYTHYTSVFALAAQLAWVLLAHPDARRRALLANAGAVVAFLPWLPGLVNDVRSPDSEIMSALSPFTASTCGSGT